MTTVEFVETARRYSPHLPPPDVLRSIDSDEQFRYAVCLELNKSVGEVDRPLAQYILRQYIESHRDEDAGMSDELRLSALVLSKIGSVEDAPLLWEAKTVNFDSYCGLDIQFVVGAGVRETLDYLKASGGEQLLAAVKYIEDCQATGDFGNLQGNREFWDRYFST